MSIRHMISKIPGVTYIHWHWWIRGKRALLRALGKRIAKDMKNFKPSIICGVGGGLGSQMWAFSLGYAASRESGLPVKYYAPGDAMDCDNLYHRNFDLLKVFPKIPFKEAAEKETEFYKKYFYWHQTWVAVYDERIIKSKEPRYLDGYTLGHTYIHTYIHTCLKGIL